MTLTILPTPIDGVKIVETLGCKDARGEFRRAYCADELEPVICGRRILQANLSTTNRVGAIRGMHYQSPPHVEMKLIRCLRGKVWDVAVDLGESSATFLQWFAAELSAENHRMMVIPEGCAHGFQVLEAESELLYLHSASYAPASEGGLRFDDPALQIHWPLAPCDVSLRDLAHPLYDGSFTGIVA